MPYTIGLVNEWMVSDTVLEKKSKLKKKQQLHFPPFWIKIKFKKFSNLSLIRSLQKLTFDRSDHSQSLHQQIWWKSSQNGFEAVSLGKMIQIWYLSSSQPWLVQFHHSTKLACNVFAIIVHDDICFLRNMATILIAWCQKESVAVSLQCFIIFLCFFLV